jgi:hypothetical protein
MKLATVTHEGRTKAVLVSPDSKIVWPLEALLGRPVPDLGSIAGELLGLKAS